MPLQGWCAARISLVTIFCNSINNYISALGYGATIGITVSESINNSYRAADAAPVECVASREDGGRDGEPDGDRRGPLPADCAPDDAVLEHAPAGIR